LGPNGVRTDGGLFISLPQEGQFIAWDRFYFEIALEVYLVLGLMLIVGKRWVKEKREKDGSDTIKDIDSPEEPVYRGQSWVGNIVALKKK
jgi:hypothetical protein